MLCRQELGDPRKCITEGKAVTNCAMNFFRQLKLSCNSEFTQYATCVDKSSSDFNLTPYVFTHFFSGSIMFLPVF